MTDHDDKQQENTITPPCDENLVEQERREFLRSLGKWSQAVIGGVLVGGALTAAEPAEAWYNRGSSWYNRRPGSWYNWYNRRPRGWYNRGRSWYNWYNRRPRGWYNRGGWVNRY